MCGVHLQYYRLSKFYVTMWLRIHAFTYLYPETSEDIFRIKGVALNIRTCSAYLHVNSAVEMPPGDYDVLHVTGTHPCRILMQASVKIVAVFVCW